MYAINETCAPSVSVCILIWNRERNGDTYNKNFKLYTSVRCFPEETG